MHQGEHKHIRRQRKRSGNRSGASGESCPRHPEQVQRDDGKPVSEKPGIISKSHNLKREIGDRNAKLLDKRYLIRALLRNDRKTDTKMGGYPNIPGVSEVDFGTRLKVLLGVSPEWKREETEDDITSSPAESDPDR